MAKYDILSKSQAGFRKGYSTNDHVFLQALVEIMRIQKGKLYCAFIDLKKAFDIVWMIGLWFKLLKYYIDDIFFVKIIHN